MTLCFDELFKGRHFDREIIIVRVRWYLRFKLSYRDLVEMMAERGITVSHSTILRWVQRYVPEFEKRWGRYARRVHSSWRMDETAVPVRGGAHYSTGPSISTARPSILCCARIAASRLPGPSLARR